MGTCDNPEASRMDGNFSAGRSDLGRGAFPITHRPPAGFSPRRRNYFRRPMQIYLASGADLL